MKKILISGIAAAAFCSAPAFAADMPVKATPMAAPMFNWTGFYIGIEGGGGWADTRHTNTGNGATSGTVGIDGGLVGGTYGYNWQSGSWVFGLEGDFSWSGIKGTFNDTGTGFCAGPLCVTDLRWLGTDRARLGYAWDRLLVYGTAGVAYGNVHGTLKLPGFGEADHISTGFVFGGGAEWAFAPSWSVKAEYLHIDSLGNAIYSNAGGFPERISLRNIDIVRVGLNYRFGDPWGKGPVVAKY